MNITEHVTRRHFLATSSAAALGAYAAGQARGRGAFAPHGPDILHASTYVVVETSYGRVRGAQGNGIVRFRGIPYGGDVAGKGRFKAAPPPRPWTGVRDALEFGPPSMQPGPQRRFEPPDAENCLFLNVWTPAADGKKRPVMFYSHGGGFTSGSAGAAYQDGSNLARTWDVVVVATNHRLGLFGYLYLGHLGGDEYITSGNQGLEDERDGLRWVHDNIERFGGDPDNVMIFGESGGGAKTSCLYAMPSAADYFNKASIESGPGLRLKPVDGAIRTTDMVLQRLGLSTSQWRQLLSVPADRLMQVQSGPGRGGPARGRGGQNGRAGRGGARGARARRGGGGPFMGPANYDGAIYGFTWSGAGGSFGPMLDGHVMTHDPFYPGAAALSKNKPLIIGYNRDEMNFFFGQYGATSVYAMTEASLQKQLNAQFGAHANQVLAAYKKSRPKASPADLYVAISTALFDVIGSTLIAERKFEQHGAPVYMYCFTHKSRRLIPGTQHIFGAAHASEIPFKFDNVPEPRTGDPLTTNPGNAIMADGSANSVKTAHNMSQMWSSFARSGRPAADGQPEWAPYSVPQRALTGAGPRAASPRDPLDARPGTIAPLARLSPGAPARPRVTMFIDADCEVVNDPGRPEREVWEEIIPGDRIIPPAGA